jgi:hypothetical protein
MNFEKGNIGVKDGTAIHRQGLYKLNDIFQKLRDDQYHNRLVNSVLIKY